MLHEILRIDLQVHSVRLKKSFLDLISTGNS